MDSINQLVREKMCDGHRYPCCYCNNDVVAPDMPKVTICKPCYAKLRKTNPALASKLQTWRQFLSTATSQNLPSDESK